MSSASWFRWSMRMRGEPPGALQRDGYESTFSRACCPGGRRLMAALTYTAPGPCADDLAQRAGRGALLVAY